MPAGFFGKTGSGALLFFPVKDRPVQHSPNTPTTGLCERGNDTSRSTGRSGRQNAATRRNMRREERGTVQGPVKKQQPDGMSHRGGGGGAGVKNESQVTCLTYCWMVCFVISEPSITVYSVLSSESLWRCH